MSREPGEGTLLYELPTNVVEVEAMRGSILFLNWSWLKAHGHYDAYVARVDAAHRDALSAATTSDWIDVPLILAHYRALDALGLTYGDATALGRSVGERAYGAFLGTIVRLAGSLGATPWFALGHAQKIWERSYRGGAVGVTRTGDRSARVQILRNPAASSAFHRGAFIGAFSVGLESFCRGLRADEIGKARTPTSFSIGVDWR